MLEVQDLRVAYNRVIQVLEGVSFAVPAGNVVALLGANGAGKSTILKAISAVVIMGACLFDVSWASGTNSAAFGSVGTHCQAPAGLFTTSQS